MSYYHSQQDLQIMDAKYEERANYFENITVSYEFAERRQEDKNVHFSKLGCPPEGTHQILAVVKPEDRPGETTSEVQFTIIHGSNDPNNSDGFDLVRRETITDEQSLEDPRYVLASQNDGNIPLNEDHFTLVSKTDLGGIGSTRDFNVLARETTVTEDSTNVEVIEIDDSSEEEILDPLSLSDGKPDGPTYARTESKCKEKSEFSAENYPLSSSPEQTSIEKLENDVFEAFEKAMDDWYSKISVHGHLKDCEIMESAQQLAQHFSFEFPYDAEWLAMFKYRHKFKTTGNNTDTVSMHDPNRVAERCSQLQETVCLIEDRSEIGSFSSLRNRSGKLELSSKEEKQHGRKNQQLNNSYESSYRIPQQYLTESPDYPLLLIRSRNANSSERSGWSGGTLYSTEITGKVGQTMETTTSVKGREDGDPLFVTIKPKRAKRTRTVKRRKEILQTMETFAEGHSTLEDSFIKEEGGLRVTEGPKRAKQTSIVESPQNVGQAMETSTKERQTNVDATVCRDEVPFLDSMSHFESLLLEWYLSLTSQPKLMVAASIFESKAVEIAQSLKLENFRPSKLWLKQFLGRHGMWCTFHNNRVLFFEPEAGLLKSRFDVEFEAWYYLFPTSPDYILDYERTYNDLRVTVNKYLAGVFNWYTSQSSRVSAFDILTTEAKIAEMVGLSNIHAQSIKDFYSTWCFRHGQFYESVEEAYSLCRPALLPSVLKNVSVRWAKELRLAGFFCHQVWMRRYLQLNGLIYHEGEVVNCYMFDPTYCRPDTFDRIFRHWQAGGSVWATKWLREALDDLVPEKVIPRKGPLVEVVDNKEVPDPPLKIASSFTLSEEPNLRIENIIKTEYSIT